MADKVIFKKIPLIKNHHSHTSVFAALKKGLDINSMLSKRTALDRIRQLRNGFNLVLGWNNSRYAFNNSDIDDLPPLLICNISLHQFLLNRAAKETYACDYGLVIENIENSDWVERNLHEILKFIAGSTTLCAEDIKVFYSEIASQGTWYVEDNLLPDETVIDLYKQAGCHDRTSLWADIETYTRMDKKKRSEVAGVKLFLDGALGTRTAALKNGYVSGRRELLLYTDEDLLSVLSQVTELHCPLSIHAIGDQAIEQLLVSLETLKQHEGKIPRQIRMEHCQFISLAMAQRARSLGIVLSMQPNFSEDTTQYSDRISQQYCLMNNPFRMLIDHAGFVPGRNLLFGTDAPYHSAEYALKTALFPPLKSQKLTLDEFIAGYCLTDLQHGYIDIEIDRTRQTVNTSVHLKNGG